MGVSESHILLVDALRKYAEETYGKNGKLQILTDTPDSAFKYKIPRIGHSVPDLYARCYYPELIILGEAKTKNDIDNQHSLVQYEAYLLYCSQEENSRLVFAVPWTVVPCLRNTIRNLKRRLRVNNVDPVYLEPLPE